MDKLDPGKNMGSKIVAESKGDDVAELMGYDTWPDEVSIAFDRALGVTSVKYLKSRKNRTFTFAEVVAEFRALEADYVTQLGAQTENAQQVRRIIAEKLIFMASALEEPFETCQAFWQELLQLGFHRIERKITQSWLFADVCLEFGHIDLGIEVLDPVIAEVEQLRAQSGLTEWAAEFYDQEVETLRGRRARLEAARG